MDYNTNSYAPGNIKVPCLNCKHRIVGCHAVCTAYTDYKAELAAIHESTTKYEQEAREYRLTRNRATYGK